MDKLRDQVQQSAYRSWLLKGKIGTVVLSTGTGKMRIALRAIKDSPKGSVVLFLAEQSSREYDLNKEIKLYSDIIGQDILEDKILKFMCYQSSYKMRGQHFNLVIADEIHSSFSPAYSRFYKNNSYDALLGLTATPELRKYITPTTTKSALYKAHCPIVFKYTINDAAITGTSRVLQIYVVDYVLTKEELRSYQILTSDLAKGIRRREQWRINKSMNARTRHIHNLSSRQELAVQVLGVLEGKTLVFGNTLSRLQELTPNVVSSKNYPQINDRLRKEFDSGEIDTLASFKLLQQGANLGNFDNILLHSYYSDTGKLVQRLGRLRKDGSKKGYVVILRGTQTKEQIWFEKMIQVLDPSIYTIKYHPSVGPFINSYLEDLEAETVV